jgi:hypothetical protein
MSISIFNMRWYGIKGETIEKGSVHAIEVVRVQTTKDGAWQALNDKELEQLLAEHNQNLHRSRKVETVEFSSKKLEAMVKKVKTPTKALLKKLREPQKTPTTDKYKKKAKAKK